MEIEINNVDGVGVISIHGELDAQSSSKLTQFFTDKLEEDYRNFVADLNGLLYSSSAGIRVFLGLARETRRNNGDLRIAAVQPHVEKIFKLSRFDKIVKIFTTVDEAVDSYKN